MQPAVAASPAPPSPTHKPLSVRVRTACELLGVSHTTCWKLIKENKLDTISIGRRRLVKYESLERLVNGGA